MSAEGRPLALVTGATSGIGRSVTTDLARDHDLVLLARTEENLTALAAELAAGSATAGATVWTVPVDLTDDEALADAVAACVGGGSNAIGIFHAFLDDPVDLYGFEAGGDGVETGRHAATITLGRPGMLHGAMTYLMQDEDGQTIESHSISAGLDYPGVGPEHAHLADIGRVSYQPVTDTEAMDALRLLCRTEGIIPAVESAHALAGALRVIEQWKGEEPEAAREKVMVVCLSGRGDKDMDTAVRWFGLGEAEPSSGLHGAGTQAQTDAVHAADPQAADQLPADQHEDTAEGMQR